MTTQAEQEAANIILPLLNIATAAGPPAIPAQIVQGVIATSTSSAVNDISSLTALLKGRFLTIMNDGASGEDVYVALHNANGGAIDETATGYGATVCHCIKAGERISGRLPGIDAPAGTPYKYLLTKAKTGTPKLRLWLSSLPPNGDVRDLQA
jgi:hypothetical protein